MVPVSSMVRLGSAAPATMPRYVPPGGFEVDDIYLPEMTVVGVQSYSIHRLPHVFGVDCDEWIPDRWFRPEVAQMDKMFMPFSQGEQGALCQPHYRQPESRRSSSLPRNQFSLLGAYGRRRACVTLV